MARAAQRLRALERIGHRRPMLGFRIFKQSLSDPDVYHESKKDDPSREPGGDPFDMAAIDALSAAGWQCITVCYESRRADTIRLRWDDESQEPDPRDRDRAA